MKKKKNISTKVRYEDLGIKESLENVDGIICIGKFEREHLDYFNEISLQATTRKKVLLNIANLLT